MGYEMTEKIVSKPKDRSMEVIQSEQQKKEIEQKLTESQRCVGQ